MEFADTLSHDFNNSGVCCVVFNFRPQEEACRD